MLRLDLPVDIWSAPAPLHAPDGFFSLPVVVAGWAISVAAISYAVRDTNRQLNEHMVPMMGVLAAFIFAAQMLNFPVAGGTSGHLVGGALAAILLGPWAALLVMTAVVSIQALVFQDGGLVVLGINLLNMAVLSSLIGAVTFRMTEPMVRSGAGFLARGFLAAWLSVVVSSAAVAVQLALSGTSPIGLTLPAMAGIHAIIGLGEGLITVGALSFISAARKDLLQIAATAR